MRQPGQEIPLDVLRIFNELNARPPASAPLAGSGGEGEASPTHGIAIHPLAQQSAINRYVDPILLQSIAIDIVESVVQIRRR